jgi:hypothetical protein
VSELVRGGSARVEVVRLRGGDSGVLQARKHARVERERRESALAPFGLSCVW